MKRSIIIMLTIAILVAFTATSLGFASVAVSNIKLSSANVKIQAGKTFTLKVTITPANATNKKLTFLSGNKSIATVDTNGKIKGIKPGKTVITVTSASNKKAVAKCNVIISQAAKKTVIKFWEDAAVKETLTSMIIEKYNKENQDNILVDYETYGTNYGDVVNLALASGNPPDVFMISSSLSVPRLAQADQIIPIDKYITNDLKSKLIPEAFNNKLFSYKGHIYGIPDQQIFMRLIYNEEIFKKVGLPGPPETLEQLKEYAIKISKAGKGEFFGFATYQKSGQGFPRFIDSISSISGWCAESGYDWKTGRFDFMHHKKPLEFLISLEKEGAMYPGVLNLDNGVLRTLFAEGKIGMFVDGNWMFVVYGRQEMKINIPYNSAPIPIFAGDKRGKTEIRLNRAHVIPKAAANPDLSWKVINTVLTDPHDFFTQYGDSPTKKVKFGTVEGPYKSWPGIKYFNDFENNIGYPLQLETALTKLEGTKRTDVYNEIFVGKVEIDKGLNDLTKRYNEALDKEIGSGNLQKKDIIIPSFDYWEYIK